MIEPLIMACAIGVGIVAAISLAGLYFREHRRLLAANAEIRRVRGWADWWKGRAVAMAGEKEDLLEAQRQRGVHARKCQLTQQAQRRAEKTAQIAAWTADKRAQVAG